MLELGGAQQVEVRLVGAPREVERVPDLVADLGRRANHVVEQGVGRALDVHHLNIAPAGPLHERPAVADLQKGNKGKHLR